MNQPDPLLAALHAARPDPDYQPAPDSPQAMALLARVTAPAPGPERLRPTSHLTRRVVLAGIPLVAGAAAASAVVVATDRPTGPASPLPSESAVRAAVLDAFERASGDILAAEYFNYEPPHPFVPDRSWMYPMFPRPGQLVISRFETSVGGRPYTAGRSTVIEPPPSHSNRPFGGESLYVDYYDRTWQRVPRGSISIAPDSQFVSPSQLRAKIASGRLRVTGYPQLRGHRAITLAPPSPVYLSVTPTIWVDATTYLPIQVVYAATLPKGKSVVPFAVRFQVLPPTPANLKLLDLPIPVGFTQGPADIHVTPRRP